jgi:hypothetical protein
VGKQDGAGARIVRNVSHALTSLFVKDAGSQLKGLLHVKNANQIRLRIK